MTTRSQQSFCRICAATCGIVVTVEDHDDGTATVLRVRGDEEHPLSRGYTCVKGRALPRYHHDPHRLDGPLRRNGRRGELVAGSWSDVLDDLAATMATAIAANGPGAIANYNGTAAAFDSTGRPAVDRLMGQLGSDQRYSSLTVDTPAKPLIAELVGGWANLFPMLHPAANGVVLMLGTNPVVSHGQTVSWPDPVMRMRDLAAQGAELWVVDPRRTETAALAEAVGGRHLQPRPSTDWLILAFLVREVLEPGGGADRHELATAVDPADLATVRRAVASFTLEVVAARTGLDATQLADLLASVRRGGLAVITGTGTTMQRGANVTEWLSWVLLIVTGSLDRPGGMWFNPGFLRQAHRHPPRGGASSQRPGPASRPELSRRFGEVPCAALASEIEAGTVRVLFIHGGNPLTSVPDSDRLAAAFERLDALVVIDVVRNDLADHATHVLAAPDQLERADVPLVGDNLQIAFASQFTAAVVTLGPERRPVWWMMAELARRLGLPSPLPAGHDTSSATDEVILADTLRRAGLPLDELRSHPSAVIIDEPTVGWVHEHVLADGRWRIAPQEVVAQLTQLADLDESGPTGVVLTPRRLPKVMNSQLHGITSDDAEGVHLNPLDAAALGVEDGMAVQVRTAHGAVETVAHVDAAMGRGAAAMTHGWRSPNASALTGTDCDVDELTGMVHLSGVPVTIVAAQPVSSAG